jgi:hypothetical protein
MVGLALLFLALALGVTLLGFYLAWTQIHSPRPAARLGIALIWPYAVVNQLVHAIAGPEPLSPPVYYVAFAIGSIAQLVYVFLVFSFLRLAARWPAGRGKE